MHCGPSSLSASPSLVWKIPRCGKVQMEGKAEDGKFALELHGLLRDWCMAVAISEEHE